MLTTNYQVVNSTMKPLFFIFLMSGLLLLGGCAGMNQYLPTSSPSLTAEDDKVLGEQVAERLLQLQGGAYFDAALTGDINSLAARLTSRGQPLQIQVADKSVQAFYVLPGRHVIITRGLLAQLSTRRQLEQLLMSAGRRARDPFAGHATQGAVAAVKELLSGEEAVYDPDAASIRLAHFFDKRACVDSCLEFLQLAPAVSSMSASGLPASLQRLDSVQAGFDLLSQAQKEEKGGQPSKAVATYLQAAAEAADEAKILGALGMAYLRVGELQPARLHLEKSVKLQPTYYRTLMGLGYLYLQQGKIAKAREKLVESVSLLPVAENLFLLAEAMEKANDINGAKALYHEVAESGKNSKLAKSARSRLREMVNK